jgi:iron complex outermembrane receptor protein
MHQNIKLLLGGVSTIGLTVGLALAPATQASAQEVAKPAARTAAPATETLSEIIVTAQKRDENIRDVPISMAAIGGQQLQVSRITNIIELQNAVSGLFFQSSRATDPVYSIRGVSSNVGNDSGVAVHLDGVYQASKPDQAGALFDVQRVEVLRGPQGTLYGRNATGGTINIITNNPTDHSEAFGEVTVGNYSLVETQGYINGPIIGDKLLGRIAFKSTNLPGYGVDPVTGGNRVNGYDSASVRGKLLWLVNDKLTASMSVDFTRIYATPASQVSALFPTPVVRNGITVGGPLTTELLAAKGAGPTFLENTGYNSNRNLRTDQDTQSGGAQVRLEYDAGWTTVTALTGFRAYGRNGAQDFIGTADNAAYFKNLDNGAHSLSQEINLASPKGSAIQWTGGLYYFHGDLNTFQYTPLAAAGNLVLTGGTRHYYTDALGVYGQGSYEVIKNVTVTVGGRYSTEHDHDIAWQQIIPVVPYAQTDTAASFKAFTPKASVDWKINSQWNAYATYSQGFKSGGFASGLVATSAFQPEQVTNYEAGVKGSLMSSRLRVDLSGFRMDYTNLQVTSIILVAGVPQGVITNAAQARIQGFEADYNYRVTPWFSVDGNMTYLDAKYLKYIASYSITGKAFPLDVSGNPMAAAPTFTANLGGDIRFPLKSWNADFRMEYNYQSKVYYQPFKDMDGVSQPAAGVINAYLTLSNPDSSWNARLWIKNILDARIASAMTGQYDNVIYTGWYKETTFRPPMTFGLTVGKKFQ